MKSTENPVILETDLQGIARHARGKVRDVYSLDDRLLIIATDRISAFDYILATGIPDKGRVLTQLSIFWFDFLRDVTPTHFLTANLAEYPAELRAFPDQVEGRSMLVKRADMIQIECVARGYISGSGWKEYREQGTVCGIQLPKGLRESDKIPEPIFTPAAKAQTGHDENVSFEHVVSLIGEDLSKRLRDLTLEIYSRAARYAETRGIIIADTKFEFGFVGDQLVLGDEVLTPDSSRFWPAETYKPGGAQFSFDKQFVRDYLESIHWNKQPPAPALPAEVAAKTGEKYRQAYRIHRPRAMNWLDIILCIALLVCIVNGFRRGFSRQLIGLASGVLALILGIYFYGTAGSWLIPYVSSPVFAKAAGFVLVFCGVLALGGLVSFIVGKFIKVTGLSFFDHVLGAGFGGLRWAVLAIAIVMSAMAFSRGDRPPDAIVESRLAPYVVGMARAVASVAPYDLKEGFHKTYEQVKAAWGEAVGGKKHERQI